MTDNNDKPDASKQSIPSSVNSPNRFEELVEQWENAAYYLHDNGFDEAANGIEGCAAELQDAIGKEKDR